jgi:hypothetical protein
MTEEKVPGSKYVNVLADNISNNNINNKFLVFYLIIEKLRILNIL